MSYSWSSGCRIGETFPGLNKFKMAVMCTSLIFRSMVYIYFMMRKIYNVRRLWPLLMYRSKYYYNFNVVDLNYSKFRVSCSEFRTSNKGFFSCTASIIKLLIWPLKIPKFVDNFMNKVIPRIILYCNYSKQWPWRPIAIVISTRYRLLNTQAYTRIQVYIQLR